MNDIETYEEYLNQCFQSQFNYLEEMLIFVDGTSEKKRLQTILDSLKQALTVSLAKYQQEIKREDANYNDLAIELHRSCSNIIDTHRPNLETNISYWFTIAPSIRGFLGLLAALPLFPVLVTNSSIRQKFGNTFFNNSPKKRYEHCLANFSKHIQQIRPLDCMYQIKFDNPNNPMIDIKKEEWEYAKKCLRPNGVTAKDGTGLEKREGKNEHAFIVIDGTIYSKGNDDERVSKTYANVTYSKDEFGAIWALKKFSISRNLSNRSNYQQKHEKEANISMDLNFSEEMAMQTYPDGHSDMYLPCVFQSGKPLAEYISSPQIQLTNKERINLLIDALAEIQKLHEGNASLSGKKYKHGDLHAGNLIVDDERKIKLIDFGKSWEASDTGIRNDVIDFNKYVVDYTLRNLALSKEMKDKFLKQMHRVDHQTAESLIDSLTKIQEALDNNDLGNTLNTI